MEGTLANITLFAAPFAPKYWASCNGALLSINTNQALFALVGTTYGGNGSTTFALPDLRGRVPVGTGQGGGLSAYELGEVSGTETNTMLTTNMPMHNHVTVASVQIPANNTTAADSPSPEGAYYGKPATNIYETTPTAGIYLGNMNLTANLQPNGSSAAIPNMMPYIALNYIICTQGIFPSRN